jgi:hypothetical protein
MQSYLLKLKRPSSLQHFQIVGPKRIGQFGWKEIRVRLADRLLL